MPKLVRCERCGGKVSVDAARSVGDTIVCPACVDAAREDVRAQKQARDVERLQRRVVPQTAREKRRQAWIAAGGLRASWITQRPQWILVICAGVLGLTCLFVMSRWFTRPDTPGSPLPPRAQVRTPHRNTRNVSIKGRLYESGWTCVSVTSARSAGIAECLRFEKRLQGVTVEVFLRRKVGSQHYELNTVRYGPCRSIGQAEGFPGIIRATMPEVWSAYLAAFDKSAASGGADRRGTATKNSWQVRFRMWWVDGDRFWMEVRAERVKA